VNILQLVSRVVSQQPTADTAELKVHASGELQDSGRPDMSVTITLSSAVGIYGVRME
jgi:hypothetical protein